jgi:hypothetical protein
MRSISILLFFLFFGINLFAQNSTSSPYSKYGVGELEMNTGGRNAGMGETGIALRSNLFFNSANPASITAIDQQSFMFDMGFTYKFTQLQNSTKKANVTDGNISWIQMGFPLSKKLFAALTINPKSSVGYDIYTTKTIEGTYVDYPSIYKGSGGLSESAALLAWKLSKNVSLGGKAGYLWGNVIQTMEQSITVASTTYDLLQEDNIGYKGVYFNAGTQINIALNSKSGLIVGGIASFSSKMKATTTTTVTKSYSSYSEYILNDSKNVYSRNLPLDLGFGITYLYGSKWVTTFDYKRSDWNDANLATSSKNLTTNHSFRGGAEYIPNGDKQSFRQVARYRFGYRYESGYLKVFEQTIHEQAISFGVGLPIRRDRSFANFSIELGTRGTKKSGLVQENFMKFNCSFNLFDRWFYKRQID